MRGAELYIAAVFLFAVLSGHAMAQEQEPTAADRRLMTEMQSSKKPAALPPLAKSKSAEVVEAEEPVAAPKIEAVAVEPKVPEAEAKPQMDTSALKPKPGESNPSPHFRRCESRDMSGTWEMVGIAGKAMEVYPSDPLSFKFQLLIFAEAKKIKHISYKDETALYKLKQLVKEAPDDSTYVLDHRGVLTLKHASGNIHQICMISSADDGSSKAGDMILSNYQSRNLALIRLFRKTDKLN